MKTPLIQGLLGPGLLAAALTLSLAVTAAEKAKASDSIPTDDGSLTVYPLNHATFALQWKQTMVYVDPVGGTERFQGLAHPNLILITDIHGDHLNKETLEKVIQPETKIVAPPAVVELLPSDLRPRATVMGNGQVQKILGIQIEAVPAYNLTPERQKFHAKGRGNGYVLTCGRKRFYISGDTEGIPEMLALKNIDVAFLCMNLPYTMDVEQAAKAARTFKPRILYPYHYRGSDLEKFKELVGADSGIDVRIIDWYGAESP